MIPKNITKEHIEKAILEIDKNGIRKGRHSSTYDLLFKGKSYPPKLIISIANRFANGNELNPNEFEGGQDTAAFELLRNEGFEIVQKLDPVKSLIENYKKHIETNKLEDEVYKWELVNEYKGRPDTNAPDFYEEIKSIKFKNLVYAMGVAVIYEITKIKPEELRALFKNLFDESKDLTERINFFDKGTLNIYKSLKKPHSHHQDERSIATYLTYHNPLKYTFYKSSFYKKYCTLLGIEIAKKNERYVHYLELINQLVENYIKPDSNLISTVKNLIPDYYDGSNHNLLAQDILYQMMDKNGETNYWIFQCNPDSFDYENALKNNLIDTWTVSAHKDKIKVGDKVIIWVTGKNTGCYALAQVTSEPEIKSNTKDSALWKTEDKNPLKVGIEITHNLVSNPILLNDIKEIAEFEKLKAGNQGTNFTATQEEYETLLDMTGSSQSSNYLFVKNILDKEKLDTFLEILRYFVTSNNLDPHDERISFNVRKSQRRLVFIIGNRYSFSIKKVNNKTELSFISKDRLPVNAGEFKSPNGNKVEAFWNEVEDVTNFKNNINEGLLIELNRLNKCPYRKYTNQDFINDIYLNNFPMNKEIHKSILSLNTILYGPPGTGKTYLLKNKYMPMFTSSENSITRDEFLRDVIQNCSWWQVIALAVLEIGKTKVAGIFNHEFVQIKAQLSNSTTVTPTIWGQLQSHTTEECEHVKVQKRMPPFIFNKTVNSEWEILMDEVKEQAPELLELKTKIADFSNIPNKKIERFEFLTFHQSYSYEDFIEGIKPELSESDVAYKIEEGVFQKMCNRARNDSSNNYAIFIDEINRGNISSIFGELITLIEEDKREGKPNQIKATLPYSKTAFSVPNNLFIIGTMNTADRSVEALDTALRRRFSFIEMNPEPHKLSETNFKCEAVDLENLLLSLNGRIEKLLDKDYCIGHSYFMDIQDRKNPTDELRMIFQNKILPLLQEYFYGDWGKIMLVIGKEFVYKKTETVKFLTSELTDEYEEYNEKPIYSFTDSQKWTLNSFKSIYE